MEKKTTNERVKELTDQLEEGLLTLKDSETYKAYLTCMSKFHNYSFNNTLLIMMQKPEATYVAGFQSWKKNFKRNVKSGEKGIKILAPAPIKRKVEREKTDVNGNKVVEEVEMTLPRFKPVTVFDVSQTEGEPIPELLYELDGTVNGYDNMKQALCELSHVPIAEREIADGAKGYFSPSEQIIVIKKDMPQIQTIKTMLHEIAHSLLHDYTKITEVTDKKDRNTKEVEAESVAFTVCKHFGIDTDDYSFGYILGWSKDTTLQEFRKSLETIQTCASLIIGKVEETLIEKTKTKEKGISEKLMESKKKVSAQERKKTNRKEPIIS